ncbi:hypothetical protein BpHYR1_044780 [Brachionus plicatilis]|uniref:Uncharacterized protein n=1 Tax=Brachionus plicatilis TaxID=10195 RepID=A0A3M7R802_BRAPC|nr:hypothetical protein BpHYR1_044780 [Brachionus plicatilis]
MTKCRADVPPELGLAMSRSEDPKSAYKAYCHPQRTSTFVLLYPGANRPSQTTHLPEDVDANMCWTCLFQATQFMSSRGWSLVPGVIGTCGLFKSQMKMSDEPAPLASKLG